MSNFYKDMLEVERFGKKLYFNQAFITQCNIMLERTKRQFDNIFLVTGMEGTGKSYGIAIPTAFYLSGNNMRVVFTWEQFEKAYKEMPKASTIVWDEFILAGMSTDALSEMQKNIIQLMVTGRKKLINVVLVVPSVFLLKNYFAVHRALFQVHTDTPDFLSRGYAYFYSYEDKRRLYNKYRKSQYSNTKLASFGFKFVEQKEQLYDMILYEKMKDEAIESIGGKKEEEKDDKRQDKFKFRFLKDHCDDILSMKEEESAEIFKVDRRTIVAWKNYIRNRILEKERI